MYCPKCGKEIEDGAAFCGNCGAQINPQTESGSYSTQQAAPAYAYTAPVINRGVVSKKEYIEKYAPEKLRKNINSISIVCYILAGISAVSSIALTGNFWTLIDVAILVGLTLGMHLGKSKVCAILLLIVSIIECISTTIMLGMPSGWWWIVAAASVVSSFVKIDKEYNLFLLGESQFPSAAPAQPFVPSAPVQPTVQTDFYYTPPQSAESEAAPAQPEENNGDQF